MPVKIIRSIQFGTILTILISSLSLASPLHVIIDPGHGGTDHGASKEKVHESDIVLKVALELERLLNADKHFRVSLTRRVDETMSLDDRAKRAQNLDGDILLSLHANWAPQKDAQGAEFYFQNQLSGKEESLYFTGREAVFKNDKPEQTPDVRSILEDLNRQYHLIVSQKMNVILKRVWSQDLKVHRRFIRQAPFRMLWGSQIPSSLVELGFISNPEDFQNLTSLSYQNKMASAIYRGLAEFKEKLDKGSLGGLN